LTSQIALIYYWLIFAAALRLRKTHPPILGAYRIPGGNWGIGIAAALGIASTGAGILFGSPSFFYVLLKNRPPLIN
jgi:hypothetical protein